MELYAGNERAHRHVSLPGLEGDVIALPCEAAAGGDLYALFACGQNRYARIVLADAVGHGFTASAVAQHVHRLLHKHSAVPDIAGLLAALNNSVVPANHDPDEPLRLTTVVTANFDCQTGELSYAYAAHPRLLLWRAAESRWHELGKELAGLPLGVISGEDYRQQSVQLDKGDVLMAFSDALTEVESPAGEQLGAAGVLDLSKDVIRDLPRPVSLHDFGEGLLGEVRRYRGSDQFDDDLTLLTLRRPA